MKNIDVNELFNISVKLFNEKNYRDSFTLCEKILKTNPNHSDCLYLFGLLYMKSNNYDLAIQYISEAESINPNNPLYLNSLGLAYCKNDKSENAEKYFLKSIELNPKFIKPYLNLAKLYKKELEIDKAEKTYRQALELDPNSIIALNNLGNILNEKENLTEALNCYNKILENNPKKIETIVNKANILERLENYEIAKQHYLYVLELNPKFKLANINLAKLHIKINEFSTAIDYLNNALKLDPDCAEYFLHLAIAHYKNGDLDATIIYCQKALHLNPNIKDASIYLGMIYNQRGYLEKSLKFFLEELNNSPDSAEVHFAIGKVYLDLKNHTKALEFYNKSIKLNPNLPQAYYGIIRIRMELCDWSNRKEDESLFLKLLDKQFADKTNYFSIPILNLNFFSIPLDIHIKAAKYFAEMYYNKVTDLKTKLKFNYNKETKNKSRIGYISADFRQHAVGLLIKDLIKNHDKSKYEIYCYSLSPDMPNDSVQKSIKNDSNYFTNFYNSTTENSAKKIYADKIDILVDLSGYTSFAQTEILALKPAPIQAQYLGYPNTMGANFIDYILADSTIISEKLAAAYTEEIVYLPQTFVYSPLEISNISLKRNDFDLPENEFVFCCFNSSHKIDPLTFDSWMNILKEVPNSVLWLSDTNETAIKNLISEAELRGVSGNRIIFKKKLKHNEYMAIHKLADLFLDTFYYNAGSTAVSSLAADLPLLTYQGEYYSSRMGASILNSANISELICSSNKEFEEKAIYLAENPSELKKIKEKLLTNQKTAPLFNIKNFAGYLEQAYSKMWGNYKKGNKPETIRINQ